MLGFVPIVGYSKVGQKRSSGKWKIFPGQVLVSENRDPHPSSQLHPSSRLSHLLLAVGHG